jgi:pimeloyl-ACP methyl ester carboxylesterase
MWTMEQEEETRMTRRDRLYLTVAVGSAAVVSAAVALYLRAHASRQRLTLNETEKYLQAQLEAFRVSHPYREVEVDSMRWRYMVGGQGSSTLLLLPGGAMGPDQYFELLSALETQYRTIAPAYPPVSSMSDLVSGVAAILDAEQTQRVIVFGSGPGGYLAQCLVRRYPERVERLILAHTGVRHHVDAGPVRALASLMSALPEPLVHWGMWQLWRHELSVPQSTRAFWLGLMHDILMSQLNKARLVALTRQFADYNMRYHFEPADLDAWPGEILILESDHDEAFDANSRALLRATYPRAQVHTFRDAGLGALFTHTQEYIATVRDFLVDTITHVQDAYPGIAEASCALHE